MKILNKKCRDLLLAILGLVLVIPTGLYVLLQITRCPFCPASMPYTYVSLFIVPVGMAFFLFGIHQRRVSNRRAVEKAELQTLYAEVKRYGKGNESTAVAEKEVERLKTLTTAWELDVLPVRLALVDLYPESELFAKAKYELELLDEYMVTEEDKEKIYKKWEDQIKEAKDECERDKQTKEVKDECGKTCNKLRAELRAVREKVAWYDRTWAEGELIISGVSWWAIVSMIAITLVGLLPIVHSDGNQILRILHWAALGVGGALLSILVSIRGMDRTEVGEQEGKQVLLQTVVSTSIGAMTAILLYAALSGKLLGGRMFPEVPLEIENEAFWRDTGLSVFWGIFAGFSLRILAGLAKLGESAFGKEQVE